MHARGAFRSYMDEGRHVIAQRNLNMDRPIDPVRLVDLLETLPKRMRGYPYNGVVLRIEMAASAQRLSRDGVFRDLVILTLKMLLAYKSEHSCQVAGSPQYP